MKYSIDKIKEEFSPFGIAMIPLMIGINVISSFLAAQTPVWMLSLIHI